MQRRKLLPAIFAAVVMAVIMTGAQPSWADENTTCGPSGDCEVVLGDPSATTPWSRTLSVPPAVGSRLVTLRLPPAGAPAPAPTLVPPIGDWGLGLAGLGLVVAGRGPSFVGGEVKLFGNLRVSEIWHLHLEGGAGGTRLDGDPQWIASGFIGPQWRQPWGSLTVGGAYRKVGDVVNTLGVEFQVRLNLTENLALNLFGGVGTGKFSVREPIPLKWPAGITPPTIRGEDSEIAGNLGVALEWHL